MSTLNGSLSPPGNLTGTISAVGGLTGTISARDTLTGTLTVPERMRVDVYDGEYTITPISEAQTIPVAQLLMRDNLTIEAIPNTYGLISWNGAYLTIT